MGKIMLANGVMKISGEKNFSHFEAGMTKFSRRESTAMTSFTEHA